MAPKVPKKPLSTMEKEKPAKPISKVKKTKKKNYQNYSRYIFKTLRTLEDKNVGMSLKSMAIMNSFVCDVLEKIAVEAGKMASISQRKTLSSREVQTAVKLVVSGELAQHANMEAMKAVTMFMNSHDH